MTEQELNQEIDRNSDMTQKPDPLNPPRVLTARVPKLALTIAEAAQSLGLSERTIESMVKKGELPVRRVGRRVLLPVDALRKWINDIDGVSLNDDAVNRPAAHPRDE